MAPSASAASAIRDIILAGLLLRILNGSVCALHGVYREVDRRPDEHLVCGNRRAAPRDDTWARRARAELRRSALVGQNREVPLSKPGYDERARSFGEKNER